MAKFMNAALVAIRDNLTCGHCSSVFKGTDSQAWKVKYEKGTVYCSTTCRSTAASNRQRKTIPNRGPCKTCGETFFSRTAKLYCTIDCYVKSDQFRDMRLVNVENNKSPEIRARMAASLRTGESVACMECGSDIYQIPSKPRKFCNKTCYRSYMAKRFDRWVANPEGMALPQCYDEFLDAEELHCVVGGCEWHGRHLTLHVNQAHGIQAGDFKRAAGFNLSTGVISRPLAELLQSRDLQGIAARVNYADLAVTRSMGHRKITKYRSNEAKEHAVKAFSMMGQGPERTCEGCSVVFIQSTPMGRAMYCTPECRNRTYAEKNRRSGYIRERDDRGRFVWIERVTK